MTEKKFIVDSWAWVEYFEGTEIGKTVKKFVEDEGKTLLTSSLTIAEIVSKFLRKKVDPHIALNGIRNLSKILDIDMQTAAFAGELHAEIKQKISDFGLADAFVLAASRIHKAKILTGDPHFKGFPEAILLK